MSFFERLSHCQREDTGAQIDNNLRMHAYRDRLIPLFNILNYTEYIM